MPPDHSCSARRRARARPKRICVSSTDSHRKTDPLVAESDIMRASPVVPFNWLVTIGWNLLGVGREIQFHHYITDWVILEVIDGYSNCVVVIKCVRFSRVSDQRRGERKVTRVRDRVCCNSALLSHDRQREKVQSEKENRQQDADFERPRDHETEGAATKHEATGGIWSGPALRASSLGPPA